MRLRITEAKIENDLVVISKIAIFDGEKALRNAEIGENLLKLLKSIEVDLVKYTEIQGMLSRNPDLKMLIEKFDLELL